MPLISREELEHKFKYHAPDADKAAVHEFIRHECMKLAFAINDYCPPCSETMRAIHKVEEVMFMANAAIARHPLEKKIEKEDR